MQIYTLDYIVLRSTGLRVSLLFFTLHPSYMRFLVPRNPRCLDTTSTLFCPTQRNRRIEIFIRVHDR